MTNGRRTKLRLASVGLGNWAGRVADLLAEQHALQSSPIELISVFEPDLSRHRGRLGSLLSAGISVVGTLDQILNDSKVEAVILPVPIHLHRSLTERVLLAGKAVLVEKPVAGCIQDVDAMIIARDRAKLPVLVGFQDTYDPKLLELKRAILAGAIGEIQSASLLGCWPRDEAYYSRTPWAGRTEYEGSWVLDSPVTNAFAHYLNLALFLLGDNENSWAHPTFVEAELYRTYEIDNYDTASQRFIAGGVPFLVMLTHACQQSVGPYIRLLGNRGFVEFDFNLRIVRLTNSHGTEIIQLLPDARAHMLHAFANHVQNKPAESALSTLEAARVHVVATNGASQAALVRTIPPSVFGTGVSSEGEPCRYIPGIEQIMLQCGQSGQLLHESGLATWTAPAGRLSLLGYTEFKGMPSQNIFADNLSKTAARIRKTDRSGVSSDA